MNDLNDLKKNLYRVELEVWSDKLLPVLDDKWRVGHGDLNRWLDLIDRLPDFSSVDFQLNQSEISIARQQLSPNDKNQLETVLKGLMPWRKGPFNISGVCIDTEWRSDWKWDRLVPFITPLTDKKVLDIGCGSGYHCLRMLGCDAALVVGLEPTWIYVMQYYALKHFLGTIPSYVLPLTFEEMPEVKGGFDSIFSMGVLYHRKSPFEHLLRIRECLNSGGEMVLETLVIDGGCQDVLVPEGRYAKMRNVWFLPSCLALESWLKRCGFQNVRMVDLSTTTIEEQRSTEWMKFESLNDFLNKENDQLTIESYPRPRRAIFIANKS